MSNKIYLGDSVYAELENGGVTLTTENGMGPSNKIILEPEVIRMFEAWLKSFGWKSASTEAES